MRYLTLLLATPLCAGDLTVQPEPFRIEHRFDATVLPAEYSSLTLQPESWKTFVIASLQDHGSAVKKDDVLISFEREAYERQLVDQTRAVATAELNLATQELNVAKLKEEVALQLTAAQQAKQVADENLDYFVKIGRPSSEKALVQDLKESEFRLAAAKEELKQLQQMYEADDLTEETEEIILDRQKFSVEAAEFSLERTKRAAESKRTFGLPREHEQLKRAAAEAAIALAKAEQNLPRSLQNAELELEGAREGLKRQKLELERLKKDGALLSWKAPADGIFLHGSLDDNQWQLGDLAKVLNVGSSVPLDRSLVSLAPEGAAPALTAWVAPSIARTLAPETAVSLTIPGHEEVSLTGKIASISASPSSEAKQSITLATGWPAEVPALWTSPIRCTAVAYEKVDALQVPTNALQLAADGSWTVEVKLADGKTERRGVTRGRVSGKSTEILSGLEPGQVVVTPGE